MGTSRRTTLASEERLPEGGCDEQVLEPLSEFPLDGGHLVQACWKGPDLFLPACVLLSLVFITASRGS